MTNAERARELAQELHGYIRTVSGFAPHPTYLDERVEIAITAALDAVRRATLEEVSAVLEQALETLSTALERTSEDVLDAALSQFVRPASDER